MTQGESSREKVYNSIFQFLIQNDKPATAKEIRAHCDCAKATFYKYLNELYAEGRLNCDPKRGIGKHEYSHTTKWSNEMRKNLKQQPRNNPFSWSEFEEVFKKNKELTRKIAELEEHTDKSELTVEDKEDLLALLQLMREGKLKLVE